MHFGFVFNSEGACQIVFNIIIDAHFFTQRIIDEVFKLNIFNILGRSVKLDDFVFEFFVLYFDIQFRQDVFFGWVVEDLVGGIIIKSNGTVLVHLEFCTAVIG